ncbi:unnamed protein product [Ceutorhynchus assimilis]|uniref:Uncharacterized protein n=1 Tax=Ceutorhynchus assimilis TaxID=467358 RepID=A0A9N9QGX4_9CUCU|nr:unnamed protein product [Ceutorhynchus assimilis]
MPFFDDDIESDSIDSDGSGTSSSKCSCNACLECNYDYESMYQPGWFLPHCNICPQACLKILVVLTLLGGAILGLTINVWKKDEDPYMKKVKTTTEIIRIKQVTTDKKKYTRRTTKESLLTITRRSQKKTTDELAQKMLVVPDTIKEEEPATTEMSHPTLHTHLMPPMIDHRWIEEKTATTKRTQEMHAVDNDTKVAEFNNNSNDTENSNKLMMQQNEENSTTMQEITEP